MEKIEVGNVASQENHNVASERESTGNGLVQEFSEITNSKAVPIPGGSDATGAVATATSPESGSSERTTNEGGKGKAQAIDSATDTNAAKGKPGGSTMQQAAGELGKYKTSGVTDAFPSSAELLRGMKA